MATDFIAKPNAEFARLADQATNASDFVNNLKLLAERNRNSAPEPNPEPVVPMPANAAPETCMRVIYPRGNDRVEIYAESETLLDEKEKALRALYQ